MKSINRLKDKFQIEARPAEQKLKHTTYRLTIYELIKEQRNGVSKNL